MQKTVDAFHAHQKKIHAYEHATGVLSYDRDTVMPRGATENLGNTLGVLSEELYKLTVDPAYRELVAELDTN